MILQLKQKIRLYTLSLWDYEKAANLVRRVFMCFFYPFLNMMNEYNNLKKK